MKITPRKRFGQHFLHDRHVIENIIDHIDYNSENTLVEIGPGLGALTLPLLERVPCLHVIEIDRDLANRLANTVNHPGKLIIHQVDALKFDFSTLSKNKLIIVGNLPYNISTPLLFHLLDQINCIDRMVLMLQKEVVDRICADPDTREYGRLSIMVQSACSVERLIDVGTGSFTPAPKVRSSVIRVLPLHNPDITIHDRALFGNIVRTAFSKRRKTMHNALKTILDDHELEAAGISPASRPEQIPVAAYIQLANLISTHT
jgi:16S rRNA (adenine1518-N6/adenine1519-N6)-dimethyltransferase